MRALPLLATSLFSVWLAPGCDGRRTVAELVLTTGTVERSHGSEESWGATHAGDTLREGDAVRTGPISLARLRLGQSGGLIMEAETLVRFVPGGPGGALPHVDVETGTAEIESGGSEGVEVAGAGSRSQVQAGGKVRIRHAADAVRFEVLVGSALIEAEGKPRRLEAGQSLSVSVAIGRAILEAPSPAAARRSDAAVVPPADAAPAPLVAGLTPAGATSAARRRPRASSSTH
jgi:hypothetical protein